jgi:hypothetical protein
MTAFALVTYPPTCGFIGPRSIAFEKQAYNLK